ncbi:MAG TPA: VOC family protein [Bryobacteraceae bacterium]|nr:VOC family protein [Bryobacteraceae bacterium]
MKEIIPYLNFDGNCREAMEFYSKCLGAELQMTPFSEMPGNPSPEAKDRIMHARLTKGSTLFMASDGQPGMPLLQGNNVSISIQCDSLPEIEKLFGALAEKGNIRMPLQDTFWGARFGMFTDRFGIHWMLNFEHPKKG